VKRAVASLVLAGLLAACGDDGGRELAGLTRDPEPQVDTVALPDLSADGRPFEFRAPSGGLLVVYFGYTNCPDVCPTTMADLKSALEDLGEDADRVDVAMVSVDPERDTPVLTEYVQSFVPGAHAIATDDPAALRSAAEPFGVSYQVTTGPDGEVDVAHSSYLFAVDDAGKLVITWPVGVDVGSTSADDLAADIRQLLAA